MNKNSYCDEVMFTASQTITFAEVSGDFNPIHFQDEAAKSLGFKGKIVHGFLSASVISRIIGMHYPGEGSVYLSQSLKFTKPVYEGVIYTVSVELIDYLKEKNRFILATILSEKHSNEAVIVGEAIVYNTKCLLHE